MSILDVINCYKPTCVTTFGLMYPMDNRPVYRREILSCLDGCNVVTTGRNHISELKGWQFPKTLIEHNYQQVGRLPRFFLTTERKEIPEFNLSMWPGYTASVKCLNDGVFLNMDTATKFINMIPVLERIK